MTEFPIFQAPMASRWTRHSLKGPASQNARLLQRSLHFALTFKKNYPINLEILLGISLAKNQAIIVL
jgi:hypothetical protein